MLEMLGRLFTISAYSKRLTVQNAAVRIGKTSVKG
jgi:hypothetical protein